MNSPHSTSLFEGRKLQAQQDPKCSPPPFGGVRGGLLFLSLGSNLGDRAANLRAALALLQDEVGSLLAVSSFIDTAPVDMTSPHRFLNAVAAFRTTLSPARLLAVTQDIERRLGRTEKSHGGHHPDRTIDIDILLLGDLHVDNEEVIPGHRLTIPHPRMLERDFVMQPLREVRQMLAEKH